MPAFAATAARAGTFLGLTKSTGFQRATAGTFTPFVEQFALTALGKGAAAYGAYETANAGKKAYGKRNKEK